MKKRNLIATGLTLVASATLLAASAVSSGAFRQGAAPVSRQQRQRKRQNRQQTSQAKPQIAPGSVIAQADYNPERPLALPAAMNSLDEDNRDEAFASTDSRHRKGRTPGGGKDLHGGHSGTGGGSGHPSTALSHATPFDEQMPLGNDPQVAVGDNFIVATEAHTIVFFDKSTKKVVSPTAQDSCKRSFGICMKQFFAPVLAPFLNDSSGKPDPHQPNPQDINRHLGRQSALPFQICDPDNPIAIGCISEAYDTRVLFDSVHHVFWVESALRNPVWGNSSSECEKHACASIDSGLPRRFIGLAVSKTEDPRGDWHEFVVDDEYADWPTIGLHGQFLVIGHHGSRNVHLFDAKKLREGNFNNGFVSLGSYHSNDFKSDHIWPVIQHDKSDRTNDGRDNPTSFIPTMPALPRGRDDVPTFLVGTHDKEISIYAFDKLDQPIDQPEVVDFLRPALSRATLELDEDAPDIRTSPVYRNGFIYITGHECVDGDGRRCNHRIRVIRIPVFRYPPPLPGILVSKSASDGFQDFVFGGDGPLASLSSYEVPALEVNKNDDLVVVYGRAAPFPILFMAPGTFYAVSFHDGRGLLTDGVLHGGKCTTPATPDCGPGHDQSAIDLAGIGVDPEDDTTVWIAHAFWDDKGNRFRMAIGKVKP